MTSFYNGLEVRYKTDIGIVDFICEKYVTVCISKLEHKSKDVCLLVYQNEWKEIELMKQSEK
jgi:hypothetical protein